MPAGLNLQQKTTTGVNAWKNQCTPGAKLFLRKMVRLLASLPFGTLDLDPQPYVVAGPPRRVRCYVRGCTEMLRPPSRYYSGEVCPLHGIRCHYSTSGATYSYADVRQNIIIASELLATRIVGNPHKYESDRLGHEKSEDALTWNVFRTLQECGLLHVVAGWITGQDIQQEPRLYLWSLNISDDTFQPWDLLIAARKRFESNLPVKRPPTEPDIALYLPGYYLILIEAKFTSPNPFYTDGPRRDARSLTKNELLDIYQDPVLHMLDVEKARRAERVYYQLWRNMVFAEWIARLAGDDSLAFVGNLTRAGEENVSCEQFRGMLNPSIAGRFAHLFWEDIGVRVRNLPGFARLGRYLETKTASLVRAFNSPTGDLAAASLAEP